MQRMSLALVFVLLLIGPEARAGDHEGAKRLAISVGIGSFDEQGSDVMRQKDGAPGNPIIGRMSCPSSSLPAARCRSERRGTRCRPIERPPSPLR